jgi:hypothetical protein
LSYRRHLLIVSTAFALGLADKKLVCTDYGEFFYPFAGILYTCIMKYEKTIDSRGFTFDGDAKLDIEALSFESNENILYLPEKVAEKFPNLLAYGIERSRLKVIDRVNFKNLTKLRHLRLYESDITQIRKGTFDDLTALLYLSLSKSAKLYFLGFAVERFVRVQLYEIPNTYIFYAERNTYNVQQI